MPKTSGFTLITGTDLYLTQTIATPHVVGQIAVTDDGRFFRFVQAGGTALVRGNLQQAPAEDTQFNELAVPAAVAVGALDIGLTNGTTTIAANDFNGGTMCVSVTPGIGQTSKILSHTTGGSGAAITISTEDPLQVALTTSSKVTIRKNPYMGTIAQPTTHTGPAVGGAVSAIAISGFGWIQTHGVGAALTDATVTAATTMGLSPSVTTAGTVTKHVNQDQYVGRSLVAVNVSAKVYPVFWQLD